jgi:hypothetical protein
MAVPTHHLPAAPIPSTAPSCLRCPLLLPPRIAERSIPRMAVLQMAVRHCHERFTLRGGFLRTLLRFLCVPVLLLRTIILGLLRVIRPLGLDEAFVGLAGGAVLTAGAGGGGFGPGDAAEHVVAVGGARAGGGVAPNNFLLISPMAYSATTPGISPKKVPLLSPFLHQSIDPIP